MAGKDIAVSLYPTASSVAANDSVATNEVGHRSSRLPTAQPLGLAMVMGGAIAVGQAILIALAVPFIILAVGSPIALLVRLVLEIADAR